MATMEIFSEFQVYIEEDQDIRESIRLVVRDLERTCREMYMLLQGIHQENGLNSIDKVCSDCRQKFRDICNKYETLASKVPKDQYYRFNDHWRFVAQRSCFLAAFIVYLESEQLISREDCAVLIGVKLNRDDGFHLDLEDYLMGLLQLASELSRLSVNAVTAGDYSRPIRIARFIADLDAGFRLLNLKNDSLRRRYDALKYDLKKAEEVVYDLTVRGLVNRPPLASAADNDPASVVPSEQTTSKS